MSDEQCSRAPRDGAPSPAAPPIDLSVREQEERTDFDVLTILLHSEDHHGLWSIAEIQQARNDPLGTEDAINRLLRAGLIHRHDEFVFPTRAATRYRQISW
jgi:hypothetical protein